MNGNRYEPVCITYFEDLDFLELIFIINNHNNWYPEPVVRPMVESTGIRYSQLAESLVAVKHNQ